MLLINEVTIVGTVTFSAPVASESDPTPSSISRSLEYPLSSQSQKENDEVCAVALLASTEGEVEGE